MHKNFLSRQSTVKGLRNVASLAIDARHEFDEGMSDLFLVDDAELGSCRYVSSSSRGGMLLRHWFTYGDDDSPMCGLAHMDVGCDEIVADVLPRYLHVQRLHDSMFLLSAPDGMYDVYLCGHILDSRFVSHDELCLAGVLTFVQLDTLGGRSLVCLDNTMLGSDAVFIPDSVGSFSEWFREKVIRYGYEGKLDSASISDLSSVRKTPLL